MKLVCTQRKKNWKIHFCITWTWNGYHTRYWILGSLSRVWHRARLGLTCLKCQLLHVCRYSAIMYLQTTMSFYHMNSLHLNKFRSQNFLGNPGLSADCPRTTFGKCWNLFQWLSALSQLIISKCFRNPGLSADCPRTVRGLFLINVEICFKTL